MPISTLENSLKQLAKINQKWKKLKKDVDIKDCISNNNLNLKKWLEYSNYVKRIQLVPKIINIEKIIYENNLIKLTYKYYNPHKNKIEIFTRQIPLNLKLNNFDGIIDLISFCDRKLIIFKQTINIITGC